MAVRNYCKVPYVSVKFILNALVIQLYFFSCKHILLMRFVLSVKKTRQESSLKTKLVVNRPAQSKLVKVRRVI